MQQTLRTTVLEGTLQDQIVCGGSHWLLKYPGSFLFNWIGNSYENSLFYRNYRNERSSFSSSCCLQHRGGERPAEPRGHMQQRNSNEVAPHLLPGNPKDSLTRNMTLCHIRNGQSKKATGCCGAHWWLLQNSKLALIIVQNNQKQCLPRYVLYALCIVINTIFSFFLITDASYCSEASFSTKMRVECRPRSSSS